MSTTRPTLCKAPRVSTRRDEPIRRRAASHGVKQAETLRKTFHPSVPMATVSFSFLRPVFAMQAKALGLRVDTQTTDGHCRGPTHLVQKRRGYSVPQSANAGTGSSGFSMSNAKLSTDARSGSISSEYMLHRVSQGDEEAVQSCIARFAGLVWMLARRVGLPESEIDDIVHEIFTEIWKHGYKYDPNIASETAFVATIARRRLIDRRRKLGRQPVKQQLFEETRVSVPVEPRTFVVDEARRAEAALTQLSNEQQRVLRLSVYEGLSHELIARSTGLPLGTVKTHARRGLIKLREILGVNVESVSASAELDGSDAQSSTRGGSSADERIVQSKTQGKIGGVA